MTAYYDIETKLQELLIADIGITTVTRGAIDKVALEKTNMYGLAHISFNNWQLLGPVIRFNFTVYIMDVVDITKEDITDLFVGNDNEMDVLNTTLAISIRFLQQFTDGPPTQDGYQIKNISAGEPFAERFEDNVAGHAITFDIDRPHGMTRC